MPMPQFHLIWSSISMSFSRTMANDKKLRVGPITKDRGCTQGSVSATTRPEEATAETISFAVSENAEASMLRAGACLIGPKPRTADGTNAVTPLPAKRRQSANTVWKVFIAVAVGRRFLQPFEDKDEDTVLKLCISAVLLTTK
jgi:hypothetical protein